MSLIQPLDILYLGLMCVILLYPHSLPRIAQACSRMTISYSSPCKISSKSDVLVRDTPKPHALFLGGSFQLSQEVEHWHWT